MKNWNRVERTGAKKRFIFTITLKLTISITQLNGFEVNKLSKIVSGNEKAAKLDLKPTFRRYHFRNQKQNKLAVIRRNIRQINENKVFKKMP